MASRKCTATARAHTRTKPRDARTLPSDSQCGSSCAKGNIVKGAILWIRLAYVPNESRLRLFNERSDGGFFGFSTKIFSRPAYPFVPLPPRKKTLKLGATIPPACLQRMQCSGTLSVSHDSHVTDNLRSLTHQVPMGARLSCPP